MHTELRTIPHNMQRYATVGDWMHIADKVEILISDTGNEDYAFLIGIHEMIEEYLCRKKGISQAIVDNFDIQYEASRPIGSEEEPGNDPNAPYFEQHQFATAIERQIADQLGVDWNAYEATLTNLYLPTNT